MILMGQTQQGEYKDLVVIGELTVQGSVSGRIDVQDGAHLVVQGSISGMLHVAADAIVNIQGLASGEVSINDGLILIAGMTTWGMGNIPGRVAVAVGTLVAPEGHTPLVIRPDGTLASPPDSIDVRTAPDEYCYFDHELQQFVPLKNLPVGD